MSDAFKRVSKGEKLDVYADAWNAMLDAAEAHKNSREGGNAAGNRSTRNADIVLVKNSSGSDVARFGVLGISGVIFTPTDSLATFQDQVAVTGVTPTTASHVGKFVVLLDPIANGKVGRGWIAGVCQVQVDVTDTAHKFCDVRNSDRAKLVSSASGSARIIYSESGTGTKWCVVRIGDGESATASTIRMGQFTGAWSNQPPDNIKTVQLYKKHPTSGSPNAFVPDDGNIVVAINLFSYIPTPRGGPSSLWAALMPIASGEYTYNVPGVHYVDGVEVQNTATTNTLWLLIAAEC